MLLFFADYPKKTSEKDGMMQRIMAVDRCFSDADRTYVKISFLKYFKAEKAHIKKNLTIYRLNFFCHFFRILYLSFQATCIYVHSVGNALAILPLYFVRQIITDMHGAVPEEFALAGKRLAVIRYAQVEWIAVRFSRAIVTVSKGMEVHLLEKYSLTRLPTFNVPIFDEVTVERSAEKEHGRAPRVIYAGGAQVWQNVDLMLESIKRAKCRCSCTFLTGDVAIFQEKVAALGLEGITIASIPKEEVYDFYSHSDYGFVLREDTLVNRVACPTKLVEYLSCGVIPIVIHPAIGDFADYGYSYLSLQRFLDGDFPEPDELEKMRENNYRVIGKMKKTALAEMRRLVSFCSGDLTQAPHEK